MTFRLTTDRQNELTWFWCQAESEMGVKSSHGHTEDVLVHRLATKRNGKTGASKKSDPMPDGADHARRLARRVHAALMLLREGAGGPGHQRVLYRVYGPQ